MAQTRSGSPNSKMRKERIHREVKNLRLGLSYDRRADKDGEGSG